MKTISQFKVFIKEIFINGVLQTFGPMWIDSDVDIDNDPYTSDCVDQTNRSNPHAYTKFTIKNGALISKTCIEKPPGDFCRNRKSVP